MTLTNTVSTTGSQTLSGQNKPTRQAPLAYSGEANNDHGGSTGDSSVNIFQSFFQQQALASLLITADRRCMDCSQSFCDHSGYQRAQLLDQPVDALLSAESHTRLTRALEQCQPGMTALPPLALTLRLQDGRELATACQLNALYDEQYQLSACVLQWPALTDTSASHAALCEDEQQRHREIVEHASDLLFLLEVTADQRFRYLEVNQAFEQSTGIRREQLLGGCVGDFIALSEALVCLQHLHACLTEGTTREGQFSLQLLTGRRSYRWTLVPVRNPAGDIYRILGIAHDITEQQQHALSDQLQLTIFESLARSAPLDQCLQRVVHYIEQVCPELRASVMLADEHNQRLHLGPAPSLPAEYRAAISDIAIAEGMGSCGTAAWRGEVVRVEDIATHPFFSPCRDLALAAGLRSCWSEPIISLEGRVLGVLAIYQAQPGAPSAEHLALVHRASQFIAIAIARSHAEHILRESEQRHRDIFTHSQDALYLLEVTHDQRFRYIEVNPAFERMTSSLPREYFIGRTPEEFMPAAMAEQISAMYRRCLAAGTVVEEELSLVTPNGQQIFHSTLVPVRSECGSIYRIVAISRDVTERRQAEQLLHLREQEFRALADNSPDAIARYDRQGRRVYVNPVLARVLNRQSADILGKTYEEWHIDGADPAYEQHLRQALSSGEECRTTIFHPTATTLDPWRYVDFRFVPERDTHGQVASVLAVGRDITALKEAELQLRALADNSPDYIARYDCDCRILYLNPALMAFLQLDNLTTALGHLPSELDPQHAGAELEQHVQNCIHSGRSDQLELYLQPEGVWHAIRVVPECDAEGRVNSVLVVGRDISEHKARAAALHESQTLLRELAARREEDLEAERKRISREVHDELGQQLTSLRMSLTLLRHEFGLQQPALNSRLSQTFALVDQTIHSVRNIAASLRPAVLDMGIALALEWLAQRFSEDSGIHCALALDDNVMLDEARAIVVFRVVQESLTNIARHADACTVTIHLRQQGDNYHLHIEDDGKGFDTHSPRTRRTFGLIGMQERALMLGGSMHLHSQPQQGTRIELHIPVEAHSEPVEVLGS
ncbi:PAS domain-containing protein [Pokkaliibacter sp. MBI-7]|uniref:PAS domain-containing protein n=1 Tax=Pokkaliibacter sp. MBI-7 TaxID=3040600 RepID=UPI002447D63A|nr:PAS domain-containing protein [Pokkaliibacter sp. MBI-7]MDH2433172.1 PAS domain-containing protein [Pokkaliibacter sp. MBI-7]